jgi:deoxyribonucleoside regulator
VESNFLLAEIAKLYYIDKVKQKEIADRFQITPMYVSRLLKKAEKEIIQIYIKMPVSLDLEAGRTVKQKYKLSECITLVNDNNENMRSKISKYLADYITNCIGDNSIIGLSWGQTILEFAKSLPFSNHNSCEVFQLSGGFLSESDYMINPSNLVKIVSEKLNCISWFLNAPFFIGNEEMKNQLLSDPNNRHFQELAGKSNFNIIGLSKLSRESTIFKVGVLQNSDIEELSSKGAIGDVAGFFIDKSGKEVEWSKSSLYIGASLSVISKAQNVICIAGEIDKVDVLRAALREKYFNILITSQEIAHKLIK